MRGSWFSGYLYQASRMPRLRNIFRTVLNTVLFLVLLKPVRGQSSEGSGSAFYLVLQRINESRSCVTNHTATCQECQEKLEKNHQCMNHTAFTKEVLEENQTASCLTKAVENPQCMCGDRLKSTQIARTFMLKQECCNICVTDGTNSELGFCENAFLKLGYKVTLKPVENMARMDVTAFNASLIGMLENHLQKFDAVLRRTIVGVYLRSKEQKCACLELTLYNCTSNRLLDECNREAYKQWLCATQLPIYEMRNDTSEPQLTKACLDVCHKVLQRCPYYLPSKFQHSGENMSRVREVIYGGYPAFDCPRKEMLINESSYSCTENCIGNSQAACINGGLSFMGLLMSVLCAILSSGSMSS